MIRKFILIVFVTAVSFSQNVKLTGEFKQGNLVLGKSEKSLSSLLLNNESIQFDSSGYFLFGFDRDDKGDYKLQIEFTDGSTEEKSFSLKERKYKIQRINKLSTDYVTPPASQLKRIEKESEIIKKVKEEAGDINTPYYINGFFRPVKGGRITGVFGSQRILKDVEKNPHNGVDIAKPKGSPIYAMSDGIVKLAGDDFYYSGNLLIIDHGQGLISMYLHMSKKLVKEGEFVKKGQKIGEIGTTGRSTGPHLHWGVQWYSKRIDPLSLLELDTNE